MVLRRLLLILAAVLVTACGATGGGPSITVGADPEDVLLAHIYAAGLRYYGTAARVEASGDVLEALGAGKVSVAPGFTGRLLQRLDPESQARSEEQVYRALAGALPEGLATADYAVAAEDKPALAVTDTIAAGWGGRDLVAAVRHCAALRVGALSGTEPPGQIGSCALPATRDYGDPTTLFGALSAGEINAAWTTTAGVTPPDGIVVLADRKPALVPAENVVALFRGNELDPMQLRAVNEIAGVLDTAALIDMRRKVQAGADPQVVAEEWLAANPLGR
jgi:glycine betaine/choline ABC-type transport system substrate-binding protein